MSLLKNITDALTGGLADTAFKAIKTYFPPDLSPEQQANIELALQRVELERARAADKAVADAEQRFNDRIKAMEGTASDLKAIPIIGPLVIFLRGCQRPLWGFSTLYMDWHWFSTWKLVEQQQTALIIINLLVLGFLFGERAIKNFMPLILQLLDNRRASKGGGDG